MHGSSVPIFCLCSTVLSLELFFRRSLNLENTFSVITETCSIHSKSNMLCFFLNLGVRHLEHTNIWLTVNGYNQWVESGECYKIWNIHRSQCFSSHEPQHTPLELTVSLLDASTSIMPRRRFWQSGGMKCGMWNTPNFTFSSRFLRLSSSNGSAPWRDGGRKGKKSCWCQTENQTSKQDRITEINLRDRKN